MTGRIILTPGASHDCGEKPAEGSRTPGTIWQCDECNTKWTLTAVGTGLEWRKPGGTTSQQAH